MKLLELKDGDKFRLGGKTYTKVDGRSCLNEQSATLDFSLDTEVESLLKLEDVECCNEIPYAKDVLEDMDRMDVINLEDSVSLKEEDDEFTE